MLTAVAARPRPGAPALAFPADAFRPRGPDLPFSLGPAQILRRVWHDPNLHELAHALTFGAEAGAPGAMLDLSFLMLTQGPELARHGLAMQQAALAEARSFIVRPGGDFTLLALMAPGDFMANTPLDFLLCHSDVTLILHFLDPDRPSLDDLPPHDAAFLALAEAPANRGLLTWLAGMRARLPRPILNGLPRSILALDRVAASAGLQGIPGLLVPEVRRLTPRDLAGETIAAPVLLRPEGSHAGQGLALAHTHDEALRWLAATGAQALTLTPFVDYRGADGMFAKYRVALLGGQAFAGHMAISDHWMVHYLNAQMDRHADRRAREAAWMAEFEPFAQRHAEALRAVQERLGLDYLALDCAELPDGRLVLFEVDTAMILHDLDDPALYPYKPAAMRRLFAGFEALIRGAGQGAARH